MTDPVVSVVVTAYNHAPFVAQALDSVLRQRTDFPVEIIVSEDCSTDGTREIVQECARRHSARRIRLMLSHTNLNTNRVLSRAIEAAAGRYVALLDADDYWTSDDKLQAQVDFLENLPEASVCFHDAVIVDQDGAVLEERYLPPAIATRTSLDDILIRNYVPSCSIVFKRDTVPSLPHWFDDARFGDWPLLILAAMHGSLGCIDRPMGAYRRHQGGVWSSLSETDKKRSLVDFLDFLEEPLGPQLQAKVRLGRAQWRVHLFNFLEAREDYDLMAVEIASGIRRGDVGHAHTSHMPPPEGLAVADTRPRIAVAFDAPGSRLLEEDGLLGGFIDAVRESRDGTTLLVQGWARMHDADSCPLIVLNPGSQVLDAAIVRLPRPDVAAIVDPTLGHSGFWLHVSGRTALRGPIELWTPVGHGRYRPIGVVLAGRTESAQSIETPELRHGAQRSEFV